MRFYDLIFIFFLQKIDMLFHVHIDLSRLLLGVVFIYVCERNVRLMFEENRVCNSVILC